MRRKKFCKTVSVFFLFLCVTVFGVCYGGETEADGAQDIIIEGTVGGVTWTVTVKDNDWSNGGILTITGSGDIDSRPWDEYADSIKGAVVNWTGMTNLEGLFSGYKSLKNVEIKGLDTGNVTNMSSMFFGCRNLSSIDLSGLDTGNVTDMSSMFADCRGLTSLDVSGFDTGNVTDMSSMFTECFSLAGVDVSGFDTKNVTDMTFMFHYCRSLSSIGVSGFKTENVTSMYGMFFGCSVLTSLDVSGFNTGNVTNMDGMFGECKGLTSLDVSGFNTENVTNMREMFDGCEGLTSLDVSGFKTGNVTDMRHMFADCRGLTSLDVSGFRTGNAIYMRYMFYDCDSLESLDLSNFNMEKEKMNYVDGIVDGCDSLVKIILPVTGDKTVSLPGAGWKDNKGKAVSSAKDEKGNTVSNVQVPSGTMTFTRGLTETETPGGQTPSGGQKPSGSQNTSAKPTVKPGDTVTDAKTFGRYTVLSATEAAYAGPANAKAKSVTVPAAITTAQGTFKVTKIAKGAFAGNKKITKLTIGANVVKIEKNAFSKCKNLKTIIVKTKKLKSVGKNALKGVHKNCKVKVPAKKLKDYQKKFKKKGQKSSVRITK